MKLVVPAQLALDDPSMASGSPATGGIVIAYVPEESSQTRDQSVTCQYSPNADAGSWLDPGVYDLTSCSDGAGAGSTVSITKLTVTAVGPSSAWNVTVPFTTPLVVDDNPCTIEICGPDGPVYSMAAEGSTCGAATACTEAPICNGAGRCLEAAPKSLTDDGNLCTAESCDPQTGSTVHTPVSSCDPNAVQSGGAYESRASILGRVMGSGAALSTGYAIRVYDEKRSPSNLRSDVQVTTAADGTFRLRLTAFPEAEPERAPPKHFIVEIDGGSTYIPAVRDAYVHPGDAVDIGVVTLATRDSNVTTIDASGGTAMDSGGRVTVTFRRARSMHLPPFASLRS